MIKVFGDSHSRIFKKINLDKFKIDVDSISGASLNGLCKINSKLNINQKIINYLKNNKPDFLILKFGQVDIDLNYYRRNLFRTSNSRSWLSTSSINRCHHPLLHPLLFKWTS